MQPIGILALQGAFAKHRQMLEKIGKECLEVRYPNDLTKCSGLILPGGESTSMWTLMEKNALLEPLLKFTKPMFGTCAGLILMSRLNLLSVHIERNAYGRQSASFSTHLDSSLGPILGLFIRAPRIVGTDSSVEVFARLQNEPVFVKQANRIGTTFHPELTSDSGIHAYFANLCSTYAKDTV